jgi:Ca2+-binding EF-hand superfamily protein
MLCCSKKHKRPIANVFEKNRSGDTHLIKSMAESTGFTVAEVERFYSKFVSLAENSDPPALNQAGLAQILTIMGMRSSPPLERRILGAIDTSSTGKITFPQLMDYFRSILRGRKDDKIRACFNLIDFCKQGYFELKDLIELLRDVHSNDVGEVLEGTQGYQQIVEVANKMFEEMNLDPDEKVDIIKFQDKLAKHEASYESFTMVGSNINSIIEVRTKSQAAQIYHLVSQLHLDFLSAKRSSKIEGEVSKLF